jgi:hypothetical protein
MAGAILPTLFMLTLGIQAAILAPALVMLALGGISLIGSHAAGHQAGAPPLVLEALAT